MSLPYQNEISAVLKRGGEENSRREDPRQKYLQSAPHGDISALCNTLTEGTSGKQVEDTHPPGGAEDDDSDTFPTPDSDDDSNSARWDGDGMQSGENKSIDEKQEDLDDSEDHEEEAVIVKRKRSQRRKTNDQPNSTGAETFAIMVGSRPNSNTNYGLGHQQGLPRQSKQVAIVSTALTGGRPLSEAGRIRKQQSAERAKKLRDRRDLARRTREERTKAAGHSEPRGVADAGDRISDGDDLGGDPEQPEPNCTGEDPRRNQLFPTMSGSGPYQTSFPGAPMHESVFPTIDFLEDTRAWNNERQGDEALVDEMILLQLIENQCVENLPGGGVRSDVAVEVDLMNLLLDEGCSLQMFKKILKWAQRSQGRDGFDFSKYRIKDRENVMTQLYLMNDMAGMKPTVVPIDILGSANPVDLVVHDFRQHLYSLLKCDICMNDENLLWGETPFEHPHSNTQLDDINDGDIYRQAYKELVTEADLHVPMGIVMFIDKTNTDLHGNLSLEPVMFTLAFFKRDLRQKHEAWRNLGYILNQSLLKYKCPLDKLTDYHAMMKVVLESLVNVMESEGIAWSLEYKGKRHNVIFKPYIQFIMGDTLGHNTICAHYQGGGNAGVGSICRMCDISPEHMDDVWADFSYTKMKTIQDAVAKDKKDFLHKHSYHKVDNAFHALKYVEGGSRPGQRQRKLHACVMGELLHMAQLGWHKYLLHAFFGLKKKKKKRNKKKNAKAARKNGGNIKQRSNKKRRTIEEDDKSGEESNRNDSDGTAAAYDSEQNVCSDPDKTSEEEFALQEDELIYDADTDVREKSRNKVLPASEIVLFEKIAFAVGQRLRHQSDRDLPRTNFGQGISAGTKMAGHEVQGALLLCAVVLVSTFGKNHFSPETMLGSERLQAWTGLFQILMCLEELGKSATPFLRKDLLKLDETIKLVMDRFKRTVARDTGRALKTQKFHMCIHMMIDLYNHGLFKNWFGGIGESNLKEPKKRSRNTQRRAKNFEKQIALRTVEAIAVRAAYRKMLKEGQIRQQPKGASNHKCMQGERYALDFKSGKITMKGKKNTWVDEVMQKRLEEFLIELLENCDVGVPEGVKKLQLYTEFKPSLDTSREDDADEKLLYRASPAFPLNPRRDWVYVDFGSHHGIIPCHIAIFVYLDLVREGGALVNGVRVEEPGMYAVCECLPEELQDSHKHTCNMRTQKKAPGHSGRSRNELTIEEKKNQQSTESRIFFCGKKDKEEGADYPTLFLISVDSFVAPCLAIPDIPQDDDKMGEDALYCNGDGTAIEDPSGNYIFIRPRNQWANIFMMEQDFSGVEATT